MPLTEPVAFKESRYDLQSIDIAAPGAGNTVVWACPAQAVLHVVGVSFRLNSGLVVGDRWPYLSVKVAGAQRLQMCPSALLQPENRIWTYQFSPGVAAVDMTAVGSFMIESLTCCLELKPADQFCIECMNLDAADVIDNIRIRVKRWVEN